MFECFIFILILIFLLVFIQILKCVYVYLILNCMLMDFPYHHLDPQMRHSELRIWHCPHNSTYNLSIEFDFFFFLMTGSLPVQHQPKKSSFDYIKFSLLFVVLLRIDQRHGNDWDKILFEDRFGDGWHD